MFLRQYETHDSPFEQTYPENNNNDQQDHHNNWDSNYNSHRETSRIGCLCNKKIAEIGNVIE